MVNLNDLKSAFRQLLKNSGSTVMGLLSLALGIGLVTLMYCGINGSLLKAVPLPESASLVSTTIPAWAYRDFAEQQTSFDGLVSFAAFHAKFRTSGATSLRSVCFTTANFFDVLRARPVLGRAFRPAEGSAGAEPVALISYELWQDEFHGDAAVPGSTIWLDDEPRTVIGVMPPDFHFPINESVWVASDVTQKLANRDRGFVFGRLKPGVRLAQARAELNTLWSHALPPPRAGDPPVEPIRVGAYAAALTGALYGDPTLAGTAFAVMLVTLFVLFLACANVSMLTLGRMIKRGREFAVRSALGATRRRLMIQLLTESLILSTGGAVGGTLTALWIKHVIMSRMPADTSVYRNFASWWTFDLDYRVLLFITVLIFVTMMLTGLWPALEATRRDVNELLKDQAPGSTGFRLAAMQRLLIISQVAASVTILVGAFVLVEHRRQLDDTHLPFDPSMMMMVGIEVPRPGDTNGFYEVLQRDLAQVPGVEAVTLASGGFAFRHGGRPIEIEGQSDRRPRDQPQVSGRVVSANYFATLNLPLLEGRVLDEEDRIGSPPVAVVNASFARRFLPSGNVLGNRFRESTDGRWLTIVGRVPDALTYGNGNREPVYYLPLSQHPRQSMTVLLRGGGQSSDWMKSAMAGIARSQPNLPLPTAQTVQQELDGVNNGNRSAAMLFSVCGAASLFLAAVGVFGLVSLAVNQRTREIGIRLALGATRGRVIRMILNQGMVQIGIGSGIGLLLALALVRTLASLLPATSDSPWIYGAVLLVLGGTSLTAVLIPAKRASNTDPMEALRHE
jgi:putative ABC transport system permease protein